MSRLFVIEGTNRHLVPVLRQPSQWKFLNGAINFRSLKDEWIIPDFTLDDLEKKVRLIPDICPSYISGMLVFRAELLPVLFPAPCHELEFLPIVLSRDAWLLLNCLKTTKGYDPKKSEFLRGDNGQIFFVQRVEITDPSVEACEIFTLEDSNRAQIFCLPSFKERIESEGLGGLNFREIGYYRPMR